MTVRSDTHRTATAVGIPIVWQVLLETGQRVGQVPCVGSWLSELIPSCLGAWVVLSKMNTSCFC